MPTASAEPFRGVVLRPFRLSEPFPRAYNIVKLSTDIAKLSPKPCLGPTTLWNCDRAVKRGLSDIADIHVSVANMTATGIRQQNAASREFERIFAPQAQARPSDL